jgi:hypothetical protein
MDSPSFNVILALWSALLANTSVCGARASAARGAYDRISRHRPFLPATDCALAITTPDWPARRTATVTVDRGVAWPHSAAAKGLVAAAAAGVARCSTMWSPKIEGSLKRGSGGGGDGKSL